MRVSDLMGHFREIGEWVDWSNTNDFVLHGTEDTEIEAIAVGWIASERAAREAADRGANVFVSHEGLYSARLTFPKKSPRCSKREPRSTMSLA